MSAEAHRINVVMLTVATISAHLPQKTEELQCERPREPDSTAPPTGHE